MKEFCSRASVFFVVLMAFTQCEQQIVGPVPNFDYDFPSGGIDVEGVTLEDVVPNDITPGSINTDGQTAFGNDLRDANNDPNALARVRAMLTTLDLALSTSQKNAIKGLNVNSLPTQIRSGLSDPNSNLISLILIIQGLLREYPQLSPLVPVITLPTGGRFIDVGGRLLEIEAPNIETAVNAVQAAELDCIAAAKRAYDITMTQIDSAYNAQLILVSDKDSENTAAALAARAASIAASNTRYTSRNTTFRAQYDAFDQYINSSTVFSAAELELLRILNILLYAIDVYNSTLLLNLEFTAISNVFAKNLEAVEAAKIRMTRDAKIKRDAAAKLALERLWAAENTCHNQGGASGSD